MSERKMKTPEELLEDKIQAVERALDRLGKIRGTYKPEIIQAVGEVLRERVMSAVARIQPSAQVTIFEDLERRASKGEPGSDAEGMEG